MLPEVISKAPLGPYVRAGDSRWLDVVRWTHYAMLEAEERGINAKNIDSLKRAERPGVARAAGSIPATARRSG